MPAERDGFRCISEGGEVPLEAIGAVAAVLHHHAQSGDGRGGLGGEERGPPLGVLGQDLRLCCKFYTYDRIFIRSFVGSMRFPVVATRCRDGKFMPKAVDPRYPTTTGGTVRSDHPGQNTGV